MAASGTSAKWGVLALLFGGAPLLGAGQVWPEVNFRCAWTVSRAFGGIQVEGTTATRDPEEPDFADPIESIPLYRFFPIDPERRPPRFFVRMPEVSAGGGVLAHSGIVIDLRRSEFLDVTIFPGNPAHRSFTIGLLNETDPDRPLLTNSLETVPYAVPREDRMQLAARAFSQALGLPLLQELSYVSHDGAVEQLGEFRHRAIPLAGHELPLRWRAGGGHLLMLALSLPPDPKRLEEALVRFAHELRLVVREPGTFRIDDGRPLRIPMPTLEEQTAKLSFRYFTARDSDFRYIGIEVHDRRFLGTHSFVLRRPKL